MEHGVVKSQQQIGNFLDSASQLSQPDHGCENGANVPVS